MRRALAFFVLAACKTQVPAAIDASPLTLPSSSVTAVEEIRPAPTTTAAPAASIACVKDVECVAVESPCCNAWPSNVANRDAVQRAMLGSDGERCKTRLCALKLHDAACVNGQCIVR